MTSSKAIKQQFTFVLFSCKGTLIILFFFIKKKRKTKNNLYMYWNSEEDNALAWTEIRYSDNIWTANKIYTDTCQNYEQMNLKVTCWGLFLYVIRWHEDYLIFGGDRWSVTVIDNKANRSKCYADTRTYRKRTYWSKE